MNELLDAPVIAEEYKPFFRTPFNHNTQATALTYATFNTEPTKTQQHLAKETDINEIVARFLKTGTINTVQLPPLFQDFGEEIFDYQSALNHIAAAKASFQAMDVRVQEAFHHDPQLFVAQIDEWLAEPDRVKKEKNLEVLRSMNLAVTPGPIADKTTLGDVLAAIKAQGTPRVEKDPKP